jgi:hypothetical protein
VESGVSGLAQPREWDASGIVEVRELAGSPLAELEFTVLADGALLGEGPAEAVAALTEGLGLEPPFAVRAVRQGPLEWAVGARELDSEPVTLPASLAAGRIELAVAPDGESTLLLDGEIAAGDLSEPVRQAAVELERRGRARFQSFVARADRVEEGRWELTIDPL